MRVSFPDAREKKGTHTSNSTSALDMTSYSKLKGSHKFSDAIVIYLEQQRYFNITGDYVITIWNLKIQTQAAFYKQMYFKSHVAIMCDVTGAVNISCEIFF